LGPPEREVLLCWAHEASKRRKARDERRETRGRRKARDERREERSESKRSEDPDLSGRREKKDEKRFSPLDLKLKYVRYFMFTAFYAVCCSLLVLIEKRI